MIYGALAMVGLVAGLLGGLLGIGGSVVMIPCMRELLHCDQHVYQAAAMIVNFFVVAPSVYQHVRARAVLGAVVRRMAPAAAIAVLVGVTISEAPIFRGAGEVYLAGVFGLFLFYVAFMDLRKLLPRAREAGPGEAWDADRAGRWGPVLVGAAVGIVAGLLGVGGGIVAVPLQQRFLRIPLRNAIANSASTIVLLSLIGAALKNYHVISHQDYAWYTSFRIAALLIPTAIVGGFLGGHLTHALPLRVVRGAFVLLVIVAGVRMMVRAAWPVL